jgi:glycosyltransferase involved in cell wall biosynthesis
VFWLTLKNVDQVVVQSSFVMAQFKQKWHSYKGDVAIIENPISNNFHKRSSGQVEQYILSRSKTMGSSLSLLYVSRFYPHKNHHFLIELSKALTEKNLHHRILITINAELPGASDYFEKVRQHHLPILNLGEIDQRELAEHYIDSHVFLFPSESETFGNPLIEAMGFGLPVVVPDTGYAHAVVGQAGIYYEIDSAKDCAERLIDLVNDQQQYNRKSMESLSGFGSFPDATEWLRKYLELLK